MDRIKIFTKKNTIFFKKTFLRLVLNLARGPKDFISNGIEFQVLGRKTVGK